MPDAERGVCRTPVVPVSLISQSFLPLVEFLSIARSAPSALHYSLLSY